LNPSGHKEFVADDDEETLNEIDEEEIQSKGLWHNINKKKKQGKKPAKPGDKNYPSEIVWDNLTTESFNRKLENILSKY